MDEKYRQKIVIDIRCAIDICFAFDMCHALDMRCGAREILFIEPDKQQFIGLSHYWWGLGIYEKFTNLGLYF